MAALLESVFNHLVLPPKLPGHQDTNIEGIEHDVLTRLLNACGTLGSLPGQELQESWHSVRRQLIICLDLSRRSLDKPSLISAFSSLSSGCPVTLHIAEQNCAIFVRLVQSHGGGDHDVVFEAFEVSPSSKDVLAVDNALQWDFPGRASRIPLAVFSDPLFMEQLALFIEQASTEQLGRFMARARKANVSILETRDSADPAIVSQMLMPMLEAVGSSINVPKLRKRVRDDVNISKAELPWRRLPFWLVLRVTVQRHLCLTFGDGNGRACYKFLICTLLSQLLVDCAGMLAPELTVLLRSKLCRRLAKLEMDKARAPLECESIYQKLFDSTSRLFSDAIQTATLEVESAWQSYREATTSAIPHLPFRAPNQSLCLSLRNSAKYLDDLLRQATSKKREAASDTALESGCDGTAADQVQRLTDQCCELAELEMNIEQGRTPARASSAGCLVLAKRVVDLVEETRGTFEFNPEQASISILSVFDLWTQMDACAVFACPLLAEYHPGFDAELLDVLQLQALQDMERLQRIQAYLRDRCLQCRFGRKTMLSGPDQECFTARFVSELASLQDLQRQIMSESERSKDRVESSWEKANEEYDDLTDKISWGTCTCIKKSNGFPDSHRCDRCRSRRKRKKLRVKIHEDFLPSEHFLGASVVFELATPNYLAAYRNATWIIMSKLAHPDPVPSQVPKMQLREYQPLKRFAKTNLGNISLASAKESFLQTHYKDVKMKVDKSDVVFPHGLNFRLYDTASEAWVDDLKGPLTFNHLCGIYTPPVLKRSIFPPQERQQHSHDPDGPSSYDAIANQNRCPADMSIHEFLSYQRLLSGRSRRWLSLLAELAAPNLNLNSEHNMHLVSQLVIQAGPAQHETGVLRDIHAVFQDSLFCSRLAEQIKRRLCTIASNWREVHSMEILINLSLRLFRLAALSDRSHASELITMAREATLGWIARAHEDGWNCTETSVAEGAARYGFWAALLCRRTFSTFDGSNSAMSADELSDYVQASVALQQHLVVDLAKLSPTLKAILARDLKASYRIRDIVREAIRRYPIGLGRAIDAVVWSDVTDPSRVAVSVFGKWRLSPSPDDQWATCETEPKDEFVSSQTVRYNYINGQLLVDGSPMGKLPTHIRESEEAKELFGDRHLQTFSSPLRGMSHVLTKPEEGWRVHFGLRRGQVVIRAVRRGDVWEYVPRCVFYGPSTYDLPSSLVENCVHWLNLKTGRLEIRRRPEIWRNRPGNWALDVGERQACRRDVLLIDPWSDLSQKIVNIMGEFEDARNVTIFQPSNAKGRLSVELRKLALNFFVNDNHLLECRELRAEIDPNQDAGTLYGFRSKLVLRNVDDADERSILAPLGAVTWRRDGIHVYVRAENTDGYGKFNIDTALGRLLCPPEPRLLYAKALLHALTSFSLPDALTGRTGTEEAISMLESGCCQPWQPLDDRAIASLVAIRGLAPVRRYYPKDMRYLQTATWDDGLTTTIQHEILEPIANGILGRSDQLRAFAQSGGGDSPRTEPVSPLQRRAQSRRLCYERIVLSHPPGGGRAAPATIHQSPVYQPRDRDATSPQALHAYQTTKLVYHWASEVHIAGNLKDTMQGWDQIGGFHSAPGGGGGSRPLADMIGGGVAQHWGTLVDIVRAAEPAQPYDAMFKLAFLSFAPDPNMDVIKSLAAFVHLDSLRAIQPPRHPSFTGFKVGEAPTQDSLEDAISGAFRESDGMAPQGLNLFDAIWRDDRSSSEWPSRHKEEASRLATFFLQQWPRPEPSTVGFETEALNLPLAVELTIPEWQRLYRNLELTRYLDEIQHVLSRHQGGGDVSVPDPWSVAAEPFYVPRSVSVIPGLLWDLSVEDPPATFTSPALPSSRNTHVSSGLPSYSGGQQSGRHKEAPSRAVEAEELAAILTPFVNSSNNIRQQYGGDLASSLATLDAASAVSRIQGDEKPPDTKVTQALIIDAGSAMASRFSAITETLSKDVRFRWLGRAHLWPCLSPVTVLQLLRPAGRHRLGRGLRELLVSYGLAVTWLQRLRRVRSAQLRRDASQVVAEWSNAGHQNWDPLGFPDWLLLEIDANILIRPEQVQVAHAIISPASGSNSVLQMNMGSGKTSCIVPMTMSVLADGVQLARLIVPKALLSQAAQILRARLGGLVGREVRHVPFSRRTPTGTAAPYMIPLYSEHHEDTRTRRGIILTTPENVLSYKLAGLQRLADDRLDEARAMIKFQARLSCTCRDVLDESDFTLAAKTQLIYPGGTQLPLDGHPHRWATIQALLSLVEGHLPGLQRDFPSGLEVAQRPGGFPVAFFLHARVEDELSRRIAQDVSNRQTSPLPQLASPSQKFPSALIEKVLSAESVDTGSLKRLASKFPDSKATADTILLIRGLLVKRILLLCLKKRWNVQYGLHPGRHPLAVPFYAKGVPSEQSEFGHPDVAITLTCLSFYYAGLTHAQFRAGFQSVLASGDPETEYSRWTQGYRNLPEHLSHWNAINLDDRVQFGQLWSRLRFNRGVLHHYMNTFVFPAHTKQYDIKIQASGWDLPLVRLLSEPADTEASSSHPALTTGFSGTNDNRMMLPLTIKQNDLESLRQTNAEVLTYLLQTRNRAFHCAPWRANREIELLKELSSKGIRVLIDAGAYILEQDNECLVKLWLEKDTQAKAAVYFGADNQAWVQIRASNSSALLVTTPFLDKLDDCLVYLDEAHTRGVDLKLPRDARGALTLALGQTKDHTVQAAMRLRELGSTQSVVFYAPPEVHQSIHDICGLESSNHVDSSHVITWLLEQTCRVNEQLRGLYLAQGQDFCHRASNQLHYSGFLTNTSQRAGFVKAICQPERHTIEELYGAQTGYHAATSSRHSAPLSGKLLGYAHELNGERQRQQQEAGSSHHKQASCDSALDEVEREREEEFEVEYVRQKQEQPSYKALWFPGLHESLRRFVETGELRGENGYQHASDVIAGTALGKKYRVRATGSRLFVSAEYVRTIALQSSPEMDNFLRPVEWILWSPAKQAALIIIPEEAELLIPMIRERIAREGQDLVHLITYMAPLTRDMLQFDTFSFYPLPPLPPDHQVPEWLSMELGIFAGRTFADFLDCVTLKKSVESDDGVMFSTSPFWFLFEWLALRRKGQDITHTPMGHVYQGRPLSRDHYFFVRQGIDCRSHIDLSLQSERMAQDSGED
ncbi:hypothetical protein B0T25DRAFT_483283 [Lasiosphaeria hispida]|uniref:ubiquitinyl hydrolase 1 n=1 Tax=Lasiosphaeria hispida TaxID=260671 RepID=A0AAJ0MD69_9PEZI|nr:hypothetical protein B0T25DRAFT_483283 [Lasiosphaeria hispida]